MAAGASAANTPDSHALIPWVLPIPRVRSRRGPRRFRPATLLADKAYDAPALQHWLRAHDITPRLARKNTDSSAILGRHRWAVERTLSWLSGYRRLATRYERHGHLFTVFVTLAAALTCYKKLPN